MTSEHQVALARAHRMPAPSNHISRVARQLFFRNLWKANRLLRFFFLFFNRMVNDPSNVLSSFVDLRDSSFGAYYLPLNLTTNRLSTIPITVLDHERSHTRSSRQMVQNIVTSAPLYANSTCMVSTGVLKSDNETELWNFAHANCHRRHLDLLCLT
jgi:hypothetical protein